MFFGLNAPCPGDPNSAHEIGRGCELLLVHAVQAFQAMCFMSRIEAQLGLRSHDPNFPR